MIIEIDIGSDIADIDTDANIRVGLSAYVSPPRNLVDRG